MAGGVIVLDLIGTGFKMVALHREELSSIHIYCRWTGLLILSFTIIYRVELDMLFFLSYFGWLNYRLLALFGPFFFFPLGFLVSGLRLALYYSFCSPPPLVSSFRVRGEPNN